MTCRTVYRNLQSGTNLVMAVEVALSTKTNNLLESLQIQNSKEVVLFIKEIFGLRILHPTFYSKLIDYLNRYKGKIL